MMLSATDSSRPEFAPRRAKQVAIPQVSSLSAYAALSDHAAKLVDVRTAGEWAQGAPLLQKSHKPLFISWRLAPGMELNPDFLDSLALSVPSKDIPLYFLCKAGVRSQEAAQAASDLGYTHVFNIAGGFDCGPQNWVASALPVEKA